MFTPNVTPLDEEEKDNNDERLTEVEGEKEGREAPQSAPFQK